MKDNSEKLIVVLTDGMSDYPIAELAGKTPLEYAQTPNLDKLARSGCQGMVRTIPVGLPPGSDVANLSVMGYDPRIYYSGRSPLEAVSLGIQLNDDDLTFRCNLVTLSSEEEYSDKRMLDYSADEISTPEAKQLIAAIDQTLGRLPFKFYAGISYRHVMVWKAGELFEPVLTPPHDISSKVIGEYLPTGEGAKQLIELMKRSSQILEQHPVNQDRSKNGKGKANSIWFWGAGKKPKLISFSEKYNVSGAVVCAVDLIRGLGICAGLIPVAVPGATGGIETNFAGKAQAALHALEDGRDYVFIHVESPDEAGHRGDLAKKIWAIEQIDNKLVGELIKGLDGCRYRMLVLPDHATPIQERTHVSDPVPFLFYQSHRLDQGASAFSERTAAASGNFIEEGHELLNKTIFYSWPDGNY